MVAIEQIALIEILSFIAGALLFIGIGSLVSTWLRPHRPNEQKLSTYESGEVPVGNAWGKLNTHLYVIAITFVLFEVETILLFPWATVWQNASLHQATAGLWTHYTTLSALLFITLLAVGLAYVWRQGHFAAIKPLMPPPSFVSKVPKAHYEQINRRYATNPEQPPL